MRKIFSKNQNLTKLAPWLDKVSIFYNKNKLFIKLRNKLGLVIVIQFIFLFANAFSCFAGSEISIFINNQKLVTDVSAQIIEGRTLVPLRAIFEALETNVEWDEKTKTITGTKDKTVIKLQIGNNKGIVDDKEIIISVPPQIINSRTMVPVRFISESVGATVDWDEKTSSVRVSYQKNANMLFDDNGVKYPSKVEGKDFLIYTNGEWQKKFLKGVNIGAGKPGTFPGELAITKEEYLRWFKYISDMNAEVIRVYTTLKPDFYDALFEFNKSANKPLYLMQGVWVNEEVISKLNDAYADKEKIKNDLIKDAKDLVDIFHGNATLPFQYGFASGQYKNDISKYVIGWVLGIEWDPFFVEGTNKNNPSKASYSGKYLYTVGASPFETFLCEVGDEVLSYEATKYKMIRPMSYTNWLTTDMLKHPNEALKQEDMSEVNVEHIKPQTNFKPGVFASYHIYPYYPDFMNFQKEYIGFKDTDGKVNTYKAYLKDLFKQHTIPILVAEFGVPASRGKAHDSLYSGYNQGNHDEAEQGAIIKDLLQDIYEEGYCGGLVFAWQDEWFKKTWNTMDLDLPDTRPLWSNPQTNEQQFGLLAFDPGKEKSKCYVDGDISDWKDDKPIYTTNNTSLFVKSDEKYVYVMAKTKDFDFNKDSLYIPIDSIDGQGNTADKSRNLSFKRAADFFIQIKGQNNSKIFVDAHYDSFYYIYAEQLGMIEKNPEYKKDGMGFFNPMYLCLCRELLLPEDKKIVPFSKYETGALVYGNANPEKADYNSLTDFCYKDGNIEIRIPWQLLNVMDPSTKTIMGDYYKNNSVKGQKVDGFYFGAGVVKGGVSENVEIGMEYYSWEPWSVPAFHERLKPSYYILKDAFKVLK